MVGYAIEIFALCMFFIYQTVILKYAAQVLVKGTKRISAIYLWSFINCLMFIAYVYFRIPLYFLYPVITIVLALEFKLISKASWVQAFCGSSIFAMHIAAVNIVIISIFSFIFKIPPIQVYMAGELQFIVLFATCFSLAFFIQPLVEKFFEPIQIQRITSMPTYSVMLLISILGTILYESLYIFLILEQHFFEEMLLLSIASSFFVLGGFYFLFIYGISLTSASFYRMKTDASQSEKEYIENTKTMLNEKIEKDYLTGVYSRKYAFAFFDKMLSLEHISFTILFIDINALKFTNDVYGHEAGDRLIIKVSKALASSVREEDVVARLGGDEFIVIIEKSSEEIIEDILARFNEKIQIENENEDFTVSASVGIVYVGDELKTKGIDHILSVADANMRIEKEAYYKNEGGREQ